MWLKTLLALIVLFPMGGYIWYAWWGFGRGNGWRGGFSENLLEASLISDRDTSSQLQEGPTHQGQAHQQCMRSPPNEKEGAAETMFEKLALTPILCPPVPCGGIGRESGIKPRKEGGMGDRCFKVWFFFTLAYSDFINKLNQFSQVKYVLQ